MFNFDDASRQSKVTMDAMLKSYADVATGFQSIATEASDFSRRSLQDMTSFLESLAAARNLEEVYHLQVGYMKSSYDAFVAEATKLSDLYGEVAQGAYKAYQPAPSTATTTAVVAADAA